MSLVEMSIIKTLSYFSVFHFPLTEIELWQYLLWAEKERLSFDHFLLTVNNLLESKKIVKKEGFLIFPGNESFVSERKQNYRLSFAKYEVARRVGCLFAYVPFVKAIFVCNSLAYNNSHEHGDIDYFIVCSSKRLWLTRLLTVGMISLLGMRPTANNKTNKIDPTFFVTTDDLSLEKIKIENDLYLKYWLALLNPIFDPGNIIAKIRSINNGLLKDLPNSLPTQPHERRLVKTGMVAGVIRWLIKLITDYDFIENLTKRWQMKIMPTNLKKQINKSMGVVVNEQMIKMHNLDRREEYRKKWQQLVEQYL